MTPKTPLLKVTHGNAFAANGHFTGRARTRPSGSSVQIGLWLLHKETAPGNSSGRQAQGFPDCWQLPELSSGVWSATMKAAMVFAGTPVRSAKSFTRGSEARKQ